MSWKGVDVLLVFLTMEAVPILVDQTLREAGVFHWLYGVPADPSTRGREQLWSLALALPLTMALIVFSLKLLRGTRLTELGVTPVRAGNNATVGYAQWLILTPLTLAIYLLALLVTPEEWRGEHSITQVAQQPLAVSEWVLFFAAAVVLAPMLEELVFRGVLLPWQVRGGWEAQATVAFCTLFLAATKGIRGEGKPFNPAPVVFVLAMLPGVFLVPFLQRRQAAPDAESALLALETMADQPQLAVFTNGLFFAAMHSDVWPSPIPLFFLGIGLAWVAYRTSSLVGAVTLHALFNAVSALALLLVSVWQ